MHLSLVHSVLSTKYICELSSFCVPSHEITVLAYYILVHLH